MVSLHPILKKSYWVLAGLGGIWALLIVLTINPWFQRHALYAHKISGFWDDISNPEEFGFAKGQVTPFNLSTSDGEILFCWHVLPLDAYLDHENEIVQKETGPVDDLTTTFGYELLRQDPESRIVINFHGNAGHVAQGYRPLTYRSISSIPKTHLLACDYRGFGQSTLHNAPHIPTESGLITDAVSIIDYVLTTLQQPASRTLLLGQSLGTAVTAASALYFTNPESEDLPKDIVPPNSGVHAPIEFAGVVLVASFPSLPVLLRIYRIRGLIPVLKPLATYPRLLNFIDSKILDRWPTLSRLQALLSPANKVATRLSLIHARNDQDIDFRLSEQIYGVLETQILATEGALSNEERRSIHGGDRVKRGAFAYRKVEDAEAASSGGSKGKSVELEIVRFGGHNEVVGFPQVNLAVRRAFKEAEEGSKNFKPGLDVE